MNYPYGCIIQTYNVGAGRVIQLPCLYDQQEPAEGFRAIVFGGVLISAGEVGDNQVGPAFVANTPAAVDFNLTQSINQNQISRLRSIAIHCSSTNNGNAEPSNIYGLVVRLASGFTLPLSKFLGNDNQTGGYMSGAGFSTFDFISAEPIFSLQCDGAATASVDLEATITVTNFELPSLSVDSCYDPLYFALQN